MFRKCVVIKVMIVNKNKIGKQCFNNTVSNHMWELDTKKVVGLFALFAYKLCTL